MLAMAWGVKSGSVCAARDAATYTAPQSIISAYAQLSICATQVQSDKQNAILNSMGVM